MLSPGSCLLHFLISIFGDSMENVGDHQPQPVNKAFLVGKCGRVVRYSGGDLRAAGDCGREVQILQHTACLAGDNGGPHRRPRGGGAVVAYAFHGADAAAVRMSLSISTLEGLLSCMYPHMSLKIT